MRVGPGGLGRETQETGGWRTRGGSSGAISCPDVHGNSRSSLALIMVTWTVSKERDKKGSRWPLTQRSGRGGPVGTCPSGIRAPSAASPGRAGVDPGGWPGGCRRAPRLQSRLCRPLLAAQRLCHRLCVSEKAQSFPGAGITGTSQVRMNYLWSLLGWAGFCG